VRSNRCAVATGAGGRGGEYRLIVIMVLLGASMDAHLVLARTAQTLMTGDGTMPGFCFLYVPLLSPYGIEECGAGFQHLKDKLGNRIERSSE